MAAAVKSVQTDIEVSISNKFLWWVKYDKGRVLWSDSMLLCIKCSTRADLFLPLVSNDQLSFKSILITVAAGSVIILNWPSQQYKIQMQIQNTNENKKYKIQTKMKNENTDTVSNT